MSDITEMKTARDVIADMLSTYYMLADLEGSKDAFAADADFILAALESAGYAVVPKEPTDAIEALREKLASETKAAGYWMEKSCEDHNRAEKAEQEAEALRSEVARLKGALAFYADEMNWLPPKGHEYAPSPSQRDWGKTARKALAGETT